MTIQESRKVRLASVVREYILDERYSGRSIYEELLTVLSEEVEKTDLNTYRAKELRDLVMGYSLSEAFPSQFEV